LIYSQTNDNLYLPLDLKDISGNASDEQKQAVLDVRGKVFQNEKTGYAAEISHRLRIVSVDLEPMLMTNAKQAVVVSEIEVTEEREITQFCRCRHVQCTVNYA